MELKGHRNENFGSSFSDLLFLYKTKIHTRSDRDSSQELSDSVLQYESNIIFWAQMNQRTIIIDGTSLVKKHQMQLLAIEQKLCIGTIYQSNE